MLRKFVGLNERTCLNQRPIVQIGQHRMTMDDVLALGPGAILELDKGADDELALLVNNKAIGTGSAVKVGENFGLRINRIQSARDRVRALGQ